MKQRLLFILLTLLTTMTARAQGVTPVEVNDLNGLKTATSRWDRYWGMTAAMTQVPVPTATILALA